MVEAVFHREDEQAVRDTFNNVVLHRTNLVPAHYYAFQHCCNLIHRDNRGFAVRHS